ncbi:MAG: acetyl-CoA C-acyltransferase [Euryarchaeota archaeon]|nr:acetyl-CoA C-acyltransferase [Euryarchaeota archaeon]RAH09489.1 MAG: acetyl-CoA C-acyltransferase [Euryarchaeota archaeon]
MRTPVICAVARTPVGRFRGIFSKMSAVDLGICAVKGLIQNTELDPDSNVIDEVLMGQVLQAGAGQNPARQVALGAGLPVSTPSTTINKVCGSSLKSVMIASSAIRAGEYRAVIAGGMESMTNAPHLIRGYRRGEEVDSSSLIHSMVHDGLWDVYNDMHMGNTGEVIAEECSISRTEMDHFAVRSHQRAANARNNGWFDWEIIPVNVETDDGFIEITTDEGIRENSDVETLGELRSVFQKEGKITAGNASTLNDGASAVLVADEDFAIEQGWPILAKIIDQCTSGVEPKRVMYAPIPAINTLLQRNELQVMDIDVFEHNEAFASASCAVAKEIGIPDDRFNLNGGAVSLGHPLGSSGTRCLITMLGILRRIDGSKGIVSLCLGGGNAVAMLIERVE